jgi:hypothetical protein
MTSIGHLKSKRLRGRHIQLQRNAIKLLLAVFRQVRARGPVVTDQAVDIFVSATLPRTVRGAEVNRYAGFLGDLGVLGHLPALVVGHALAHRQRHTIERGAEALHRICRRTALFTNIRIKQAILRRLKPWV